MRQKWSTNTKIFLGFFCFSLFVVTVKAAGAVPETPPPVPPGTVNKAYSKVEMNPTLAVILAGLVLLLMACVFIYMRRMDHNSIDESVRFRFWRPRPANRGLEPSIIEAFPVFVYSDLKALNIGKATLECAVCLHEFEEQESLRVLVNKCCHVFHPECIDAWLAFRATCPLCRCDLKMKPGEVVQTLPGIIPDTGAAESALSRADSVYSPVFERNDTVVDIHVPNSSTRSTPRRKTPNYQNLAPRSTPRRPRILRMFSRSHSTGHSLVQLGEDREKYTLRLSDDVWKRLVDLKLSRDKNGVVPFTPERSSTNGYRCKSMKVSVGSSNQTPSYDRFDARSSRPRFLSTPSGSSKEGNGAKHISMISKNMFKSVKSPLSLFRPKENDNDNDNDVGERSFAYLRSSSSS